MLRDTDTCYERADTVVASAENLAVSHGHRARTLDWSKMHWNWRARRLMEAAYHRACAEHGDGASLLGEWQACEARMRTLYNGGTP
jgi:hypothetical protein